MVDVILGLQWGDEGKGKIVDYFAKDYDIIARFQGGPNAGHTLYIGDDKVVLHQIPSGIFHADKMNLIGSGVVLDPVTFKKECDAVVAYGVDVTKNLKISLRTNLILPTHRALDRASEAAKGKDKIGSTLKGIGPAYMDKTGRNALRVSDVHAPYFNDAYEKLKAKHLQMLGGFDLGDDLEKMETEFFEAVEFLRTIPVVAGEYFINDAINGGKKILAEGAQGSMLDVDFGTFPFVTSSNTISAGVCTGLGIAPQKIREVIGITKAYCTRVGSGPFPTELFDDTGDYLRNVGKEFGATTGRPRRCGWIDLVALKYACMINGTTSIVMTKADILDGLEYLKLCTSYLVNDVPTIAVPCQMDKENIVPVYDELKGWYTDLSTFVDSETMPPAVKSYIEYINNFIGVPVKYISNGPGREQIVKVG